MVLCLKIWRVGRCQAFKIMKIASSLKSLKKGILTQKLLSVEENFTSLIKKNPKFKARQG